VVAKVAVVLLELAERIVRVHAQLLRAAAREVLHVRATLVPVLTEVPSLIVVPCSLDQRLQNDVGIEVGVSS